MHFSLKIWHLVATIVITLLRINWPNFSLCPFLYFFPSLFSSVPEIIVIYAKLRRFRARLLGRVYCMRSVAEILEARALSQPLGPHEVCAYAEAAEGNISGGGGRSRNSWQKVESNTACGPRSRKSGGQPTPGLRGSAAPAHMAWHWPHLRKVRCPSAMTLNVYANRLFKSKT